MHTLEKIGFIGGGNMAEALIRGLVKGTFPAGQIVVSEPSAERQRLLTGRYGISFATDNRSLVRECPLVILAIKPQLLSEVVGDFAAALRGEKLLLSILAGVTTTTLEASFDGRPRVVRAMPNTPALVGEGATALCAGRFATVDDLTAARHIFEAVGSVQLVAESQMDAVTGLSGSGPAYVFTVIEALADGGVREGLSRETALQLAVQTVLGAARLVKESGEHPALLRDKVCSPGGTTIAAVQTLEDRGLRGALMAAVAAAARRSRELGGG